MSEARRTRTRAGGRESRRAARMKPSRPTIPYLTRTLPPYEVLSEEGLETIEANAEIILEETGINSNGDAEALAIWKDAGAAIDGQRVRFPRGFCRSLIQRSAPAEFVQHT